MNALELQAQAKREKLFRLKNYYRLRTPEGEIPFKLNEFQQLVLERMAHCKYVESVVVEPKQLPPSGELDLKSEV